MTDVASSPDRSIAPEAWSRLGELLSREPVLLVAEDSLARFAGEWREIDERERNLDDSLLVALVGGTGVGKSTFINALAGAEISRSGDRRPTTDRVVAYRHADTELPEDVPTEDLARPEVCHRNERLARVTILDFPDFDSADTTHAEILERFLPHLDVLLVVVDDMKYGDRRLFDLLRALPHSAENLYAVLNKLDRLELRYREDAPRVADEILADLRAKLEEHAGIRLPSERTVVVSALRRLSAAPSPGPDGFADVERILDGFREEKRRRAAKLLNLAARRAALAADLRSEVLSEEKRSMLESGERLVSSLEAELDTVLLSIPRELFSEPERRSLRRGRSREVAAAWGFPFSVLWTIAAELPGLRARGGSASVDGESLAGRILEHHRAYLDGLRNFETAFEIELAGSILAPDAAGSTPGGEARARASVPRTWAREEGSALAELLSRREAAPSPRRRWLAHAPAAAVLILGIWSLFHPLLARLVEEGFSWGGLGGGIVRSLVRALDPFFLSGLAVGALVAYGATALWIWGRAAHGFDERLAAAERQLRERARALGGDAMADARRRLSGYREEWEAFEAILDGGRER